MKRRELQLTIDTEHRLPAALEWVRVMATKGLPGGPVRISIGRPRRTLDQSAKFHAICGDVAKQATWMGKTLRADQWKVLFVSGHAIATGQGAEVVPGLESEFVNIRESTAHMTKGRLSSLIEYVLAWCGENEIEIKEYREAA